MNAPLLLALRQLAHDRVKTALLAGCLALAVAIPLVTALQTDRLADRLTARADTTPVVIGPEASELGEEIAHSSLTTCGVTRWNASA